MDFDQIHTFLEIVRLKSFSKAAQTCYRTQPAISAQIRQLEHELKCELFERFGSRISLTTAGKLFAQYAEQMIDVRRQAQNALNELESTPRGELVIAANEATCIYVLPGVFAEYKTQFPGVQLQVNRSYGSRIVEAVMENVADFGLTQLPVAEKRVQIVDIYKDEVRLVVPVGHPLANAEKISCADIVPYPLLLPQSGMTRTRLNAWFEKVEDDLQISMELDSTETMKRFVIAGLGISFLSGATAQEEVTAGALRSIPLAPEPMMRKLGLIYRKTRLFPRRL
jgi:DNA-binding transcriptional LysR family regulator